MNKLKVYSATNTQKWKIKHFLFEKIKQKIQKIICNLYIEPEV